MATVTKEKLSQSTDGKGILIAATATAGTAIHTATASTTTTLDEVWLWATNTSANAVKLTLELGGAGAGDQVEQTIAAEAGPVLVCPGWVFQNSAAIAAFAETTNVINVRGFVNRIVNT